MRLFPSTLRGVVSFYSFGVYRTIKDLLQHTILKGERNSFLVIGPKASGKTYVSNNMEKLMCSVLLNNSELK